jgi:hypothetical protein
MSDTTTTTSDTTTPIEIDVSALKATVEQLAEGTGAKKPAKKPTTKTVKAKAAPKPKTKKAETPVVPTLTAADIESAAQQVSTIVQLPVLPPVSAVPPPIVAPVVPTVVPTVVATVTVKPEPLEFLEGTPDIVVKLMQTGVTEMQTVKALVSQVEEHPEIKEWAAAEIKPGRPKASLVSFYAVKRGVRTALNIDKPAPKKANLSNAADLASKLSVPSSGQSQTVANGSPASILEALKPGAQPLRKFTNENSGRVFLLWSDYLAAKSGQYTLRFRKFTVGENSKPGKGTPSVYLLKGETDKDPGRTVAKLSAREFIIMLDFLNKLGSSGALAQIFQALVAMEKE